MISFNSLNSEFELQKASYFKSWLVAVIEAEKKIVGEIQYVFCDDKFLLTINQTYLNHDTLTDIITFPTSTSGNILSGEIYISIPRVKENAELVHQKYEDEIARVLVHGVLHLIGYNDSTISEKTEMRAKEDYYLNLQP